MKRKLALAHHRAGARTLQMVSVCAHAQRCARARSAARVSAVSPRLA
jgi:hypothetical protein